MFSFPLLEEPTMAFKLLMGQDVDLFLFDIPKLEVEFTYIQAMPVFPAVMLNFGGFFRTFRVHPG